MRASTSAFSIIQLFRKSRNRKCPSFRLLRNLITHLHPNFPPQLSADSSSTETLYCLISVQWLEVVLEITFFFRFSKVSPRKFDVLKTNICPRSEASRANMLVLRTSNFQGATIRPIVPRHKHSIVFIVHH